MQNYAPADCSWGIREPGSLGSKETFATTFTDDRNADEVVVCPSGASIISLKRFLFWSNFIADMLL